MNRLIGSLVSLGLSAAMLAGCAGAESDEVDEPEEYVFSTSVEIDADGEAHVVVLERLTREEMQRQIDARLASLQEGPASAKDDLGTAEQALSIDSGCGLASLWMYDKPFVGGSNSGNRLCIRGPGVAGGDGGGSYALVCRTAIPKFGGGQICTSRWGQAVKAYWPGVDPGFFYNTTNACGGPYGIEAFDGYTIQGQTNAGSCAQAAGAVYFGPFIP
jgi:hypothetical protein